MSKNLKHSPEGLKEAFGHHLFYEIDMLRATSACLASPSFRQIVVNALIESFCIHARNLIEFFDQKSGTPGSAGSDYVGAKHFTTKDYVCWTGGEPSNELRARLNRQVSHLTYQRTVKNAEKIGPNERNELLTLIERELIHFQNHLRAPYDGVWRNERQPRRHLDLPIPIQSATNHVTSTTTATTVTTSSAPQYVLINKHKPSTD
jgi:hypothetical protein